MDFMMDAICHKNGDGDGSPDDLFVLRGRTKMDEAIDRFNLRAHPTKRTRLCITLRPRLLFFTTPCLNSDYSPQLSTSTATSTPAQIDIRTCPRP